MQLQSMIEDRTSKGIERVMQSLAWCPIVSKPGSKENFSSLCAVATSLGSIKLFDISRNRVIQTYPIYKDASV